MFFLTIPVTVRLRAAFVAVLALALLTTGCTNTGNSATANDLPHLATTTSWLECCLRDLMGDGVRIVRLCPPGQCPGHFDMKPSALKDLRACQALFRFDFQSAIDAKLNTIGGKDLRIVAIDAPEGLCLPGGYRDALRQTHAALAELFPDRSHNLDAALSDAESRLDTLENQLRKRLDTAGQSTRGLKIAVSGHQAAFCRWLGMDPVVTYSGANATAPARIEALVAEGKQAGIRLVVANLQEGRQMGEALAWQFDVPVTTFSNFPQMNDGECSFGDLLSNNVDALLGTLGEAASQAATP